MIKWEKPNGQIVETNEREETIAAAKENGWKRAKAKKESAKIEPKEEQKELI
jgi:hypothetical protein